MSRTRLKVPAKLAVVAIGVALAGCPETSGTPDMAGQGALCPPEWMCSSDAARAFNCTDASDDPFGTDAGTCFPPI